jgi:hypothetical protein
MKYGQHFRAESVPQWAACECETFPLVLVVMEYDAGANADADADVHYADRNVYRFV